MSHSETQLESRTVFEGRVITVTFDKVRLAVSYTHLTLPTN